MTMVLFLAWVMIGFFLFATASSLALGPTKYPIQWILVSLFLEVKWTVCEAVPHSHLVQRLLCGAIPPLPNMSS